MERTKEEGKKVWCLEATRSCIFIETRRFQMTMYFDLTVDVLDLFEIAQSMDSMNKFQLHQFWASFGLIFCSVE